MRSPAQQLILTIARSILVVHFVGSLAVAEDPRFGQIAAIVEQGIDEGEMPGAVVAIADQDCVLYCRAFGHRQIEPAGEVMTTDTVFDMASLTKPIVTATSVMRLVQDGLIDVEQPVARYLPEFAAADKQQITVGDLLLHVGGLIPDNALRDYQDGPDESWRRIWKLKPISSRGENFAYTDVGFMVLGKLVERQSGKTLDAYAKEIIFGPLSMTDSGFLPGDQLSARIAPTEKRDGQWIRGDVHDPRAHLLGGVAGHAGLFSTAEDLARYGQMMLGRGTRCGVRVLDEKTFALMTRPREIPRGTRTFGWDHRSPYSKNRGESFSEAAFGHGGFTGTVMWIDPEKKRVFIFLSNRLHPDGEGAVNALAGRIATIVGLLD